MPQHDTDSSNAFAVSAGFRLPDWLASSIVGDDANPEYTQARATDDDRAALAVELSRRNIEHGTGGPFGCVIYERDSGVPFAFGVNLVESANLSTLHGEVVAIAMAQARLGRRDLGTHAHPLQLVTSAAPCCMCIGAIHWCGVESIVCAAANDDVEAVGFDEGPMPADWPQRLRNRGVEVTLDVQREQAAQVLRDYVAGEGRIYNA